MTLFPRTSQIIPSTNPIVGRSRSAGQVDHPHVWIGFVETNGSNQIVAHSGSWQASPFPDGDPEVSLITDGRFRITFSLGAPLTEGRFFLSPQDATDFSGTTPVLFQVMESGPLAVDIWTSDLGGLAKTPVFMRYKLELYLTP